MFYESGLSGPVRLRFDGAFCDWKPPRHARMGEFLSVCPMLEDASDTVVRFKRKREVQVIKASPAKALA